MPDLSPAIQARRRRLPPCEKARGGEGLTPIFLDREVIVPGEPNHDDDFTIKKQDQRCHTSL